MARYCPGGELHGAGEWVVWYAGVGATAGLGVLGLTQTAGADPLVRAPFGVMLACACVGLFAVGGQLALLGFALAHGQAVATWLGTSLALDDMLDRCNTLRDRLWARHAWQVALAATTLAHVSLWPGSDAAIVAWTALAILLWVAQAVVLVVFRHTARRQLEGDDASDTVATVRRCCDLAAGSAVVAAAGVLCLAGISGAHDRGDRCGEFAVVQSLLSMPAFAAVLYSIAAVAALRAEAKHQTARWTMWRGFVPLRADPAPPTAEA